MNRFNVEDIIRFVNEEMTETERKEFQLELQQDEQLKADYELYLKVNKALKVHSHKHDIDDLAFKENLKRLKWDHFGQQEQNKIRKLKMGKLYYAAAIILVALFIWAPWNKNQYNEFFEAKMVSVEERGDGDNLNLLKEATTAFNKHQFESAKEKLKILLSADQDNDMLKYYYGISLMQTDDLETSRQFLEQVYNGESVFKDEAAYYLALGYLKQKDKIEAKAWLLKVDKDAEIYKKSEQLLKEID